MILVGARFRALAAARAALRAVRASASVVPGDVGVRPLGTTRYDAPVEEFLLAGRFEPGEVETVIRILHSHGGRIVVRRIETPRLVSAEPSTAPVTAPSAAARLSIASHIVTRLRPVIRAGAHKRLRRPSPPLRVRTARSHRIGG